MLPLGDSSQSDEENILLSLVLKQSFCTLRIIIFVATVGWLINDLADYQMWYLVFIITVLFLQIHNKIN